MRKLLVAGCCLLVVCWATLVARAGARAQMGDMNAVSYTHLSPKPTPGLTATLASSSSFFENSTDPIARYRSGIRAQTNIVAFGISTGQPS